MKRFKQYIIIEGVGVVKKQFEKSKKNPNRKLPVGIIDKMVSVFSKDYFGYKLTTKQINKYIEWAVRVVVYHIENKQLVDSDSNFKEIKQSIYMWDILRQKKIVSNDVPPVKNIQKIIVDIDKIVDTYAKQAKHKIPTGLKEGEDYEHVYNKDGIEIFKIITHEASIKLGGKSKWCIRSKKEKWWNDICQNFCFYFIVNHHQFYNKFNILAAQVGIYGSGGSMASRYWDMEDNPYNVLVDINKKIFGQGFEIINGFEPFKPQIGSLNYKFYVRLQSEFDGMIKDMKDRIEKMKKIIGKDDYKVIDIQNLDYIPQELNLKIPKNLIEWWEDHNSITYTSIFMVLNNGGDKPSWDEFYKLTSPTPMEYYNKHTT